MRALSGLPSDSKTLMIANTRRNGEARGIYYSVKKGPQSVCLSASLTGSLAGWLAGWLAVHLCYRRCCCRGPPQQSLAGLLKPAPGPQPAACLLYTINLCSLEMVQGCREAPRHCCPARLAKAAVAAESVRGEAGESEEEEG